MLSKAYRRYVYCIEWMASIQNTPTRLEPTIRHFSVFFDRKKHGILLCLNVLCSTVNRLKNGKIQKMRASILHAVHFRVSLSGRTKVTGIQRSEQ